MKVEDLLPVGAVAPQFSYSDADGFPRSTADLAGKPFLVYFYPKDNTPGCTAEACSLRDAWPDFGKLGLFVIGVSFDDEDSHERFRKRHRLPFGLASDEDKKIARAFGVYQPRQLLHQLLPFPRRVSFLIDKAGLVAQVFPEVNPARHADEVLRAASRLS